MAQITLTYDARNQNAKKTLDYILSLSFFKPVEKSAIDLSLDDVKRGRVTTHKSSKDYFEKFKN